MKPSLRRIFCAAALLLAFSALAQSNDSASPAGEEFRLELLDSKPGWFVSNVVINNAGDIAAVNGHPAGAHCGLCTDSQRTLRWSKDTTTPISSDGIEFSVAAINQAGMLAGAAGKYPSMHAAQLRDSVAQELEAPAHHDDDYISGALALDNHGRLVGWSAVISKSAAPPMASMWDHGLLVDLGSLIHMRGESAANGISDAGTVVGYFWADETPRVGYRAVEWHNKSVTYLSVLKGRKWSEAAAINDLGEVVGWSDVAASAIDALRSEASATLWINRTPRDLGHLSGFPQSYAIAINHSGQIVGSADDRGNRAKYLTSEHHAVYWGKHRAIVDLNSYVPEELSKAGWALVQATGINDSGVIVGTAFNQNSYEARPFRLSPVNR